MWHIFPIVFWKQVWHIFQAHYSIAAIMVDKLQSRHPDKMNKKRNAKTSNRWLNWQGSQKEIPFAVGNPQQYVFAASQQCHHLHQSERKQYYIILQMQLHI